MDRVEGNAKSIFGSPADRAHPPIVAWPYGQVEMIRNANWITELQHRASRGEVAHGTVDDGMAIVEDDQALRSRSLFAVLMEP